MDFFRGSFLKLQGILYHGVVVRRIKTSTCHVALIKANDKKYMQVFWCFWPLIEKQSPIDSPLEWQGRGVHLDVCVRVDPDLQRTFKVKTCSLHQCNVKDALFQTGWPEKSQDCSEFASFFFVFLSGRGWKSCLIWYEKVNQFSTSPTLFLYLSSSAPLVVF